MRDMLAAVAWLAPKGLSILVAVSGGPDSLCLLDALTRQAARRGWRLGVACLDHGLRPESRVEAARVRAEAEARSLPFYTTRMDVRGRARRRKHSLEATAREARYAWLAAMARRHGFQAVATGHTADDQAETVLLRLLRGAGVTGLAAMRPDGVLPGSRPPVRLLRPLLTTTRAEVEAYNRARELQASADASNGDPAYTRNRIRLELLPALETYNPNIRRTLVRLAEVTAGEAEALAAYGAVLWDQLAPRRDADGWVFARPAWKALPRAAQRLVLRRAALSLVDEEAEIGFDALDAALDLAERGTVGRVAELGGGVSARITRDALTVATSSAPEPSARLPRLRLRRVNASLEQVRANPDPLRAFVDLDVVAKRLGVARAGVRDLRLRWPAPGDRFQPLGLRGRTQRLSDFLSNARVPRDARATTPIVLCGDAILWVVGQRLAHWARVTEHTTNLGELRLDD